MGRPEFVTPEMLKHLDVLHDGGNFMYSVGPQLETEFLLSHSDARTVLAYWMEMHSQWYA